MDVEAIFGIVMVFGTGMLAVVAFSPIGKAIADRLSGRRSAARDEELDEVRDQLVEIRHQLSELAERQDFTERMVAQSRDKAALKGGAEE